MTDLPSTDRLELDNGTQAWDDVLDRLTAFVESWEGEAEPPRIADYLPESPPTLVRLVLVELIKADLEYRWKQDREPRTIEQYAEEFPSLRGSNGLPCDLIVEEYLVRQQLGLAGSPDDYLQRFADQAKSLERLFAIQTHNRSGTLRMRDDVPQIEPGQRLDDFDLLETLGQGAFARVMLARQNSMQRLVALKVSRRCGQEAQTLAQLDHPNIVRVYDQRFLSDEGLGLLYMEYVRGDDLAALVRRVRETPPSMRNGQLVLDVIDAALARHDEQPSDELARDQLSRMQWDEVVCWVGAQLAAAIDYAHRRDTLHRDIKPANVLLSAEGIPKLADFNVSFSSKLEGATPEAFFGGSLAYMSPEHLEAYNAREDRDASEVTGQSDIYSLGVLLWELMTGQRPFADESLSDDWYDTLRDMTRRRRRGLPAEALAAVPEGCQGELVEILRKALAPEPADRFATAAEMARRLQVCLTPEVQRIRRRPEAAWYGYARRRPLVTAIWISLIPNLVLSALNVSYDWFAIVKPMLSEQAQVEFLGRVITFIKLIHYAIGIPVGVWYALPIFLSMRNSRGAVRDAIARRHALRIGDMVFFVTMGAWSASGIVFPAWIDFTAVELTPMLYAHFFSSHILCGLISGIFCFFLLTLTTVRVYFPRLAQVSQLEAADAEELAALRKRVSFYSFGALVVPFASALMLGVSDSEFRASFIGLGVLGAGLLYVANRIARDLLQDIDGLSFVAESSTETTRPASVIGLSRTR